MRKTITSFIMWSDKTISTDIHHNFSSALAVVKTIKKNYKTRPNPDTGLRYVDGFIKIGGQTVYHDSAGLKSR